MKTNTEIITHCKQCGTCCRKGGPSLHIEDKELLQVGHIGFQNLVTLRQGELAHNPLTNKIEPLTKELVKIAGNSRDWTCVFLDGPKNTCKIYTRRPLECRLLKCWDPAEVAGIIGKNTLVRFDVINTDDRVRQLIEIHERECSYHTVGRVVAGLSQQNQQSVLSELTEYVRKDITIRLHAIKEVGLAEEYEFFIFGRPLFVYLMGFDISITENASGIELVWTPPAQ